MYEPVENRLFTKNDWDDTLLYPLLTAGVAEMKEKLCTYAKDQPFKPDSGKMKLCNGATNFQKIEELLLYTYLEVKRRRQVAKQIKEEDMRRSKKRREKMVHEKQRREALLQRKMKEKEKLCTLHLITSSAELCDALSDIDSEDISDKKKTGKKRALLRDQINIRKKLLQ